MFRTRVFLPDDGDQQPVSGDGVEAGGGAGAPTPADMPGADTTDTPDTGADDAGQDTPDDGTDWRAKYEQALRESRKWESRAKGNKTAQEQLDTIVKALNPDASSDGGKPDPQQVIETARAAQREAQTELAVYRAAANHGADPDKLLDSRRFMAQLANLDTTADDYQQQVEAAVTEAAKATTTARTGRSGNEIDGGTSRPEMDPRKLAEAATKAGGGLTIY